MKRDFLKGLGLEEEAIEKIMAEHGKTVNDMKGELEEVDTLKSQLADKDKEIENRDQQLEELSKKAKGNEELTAEIENLKSQNEETKSEYEKRLAEQKKDFAIEKALADAKDVRAAKALLDLEKIELDKEGKVTGLDEQAENLKKENAWLFKTSEKPNFSDGSHQAGGYQKDAFVEGLGIKTT